MPDGQVKKARWEVAGHPQLGLPGPSEELLLFVLMQLTREAADENGGTWPKTVHFSRYAFFDAKSKLPIADANFHMLESSNIVDEPRGRKGENQLLLSWFSWSDVMHDSFVAGNVRSLALEFVLRLELPLSRRLSRFLDAMRWSQKPARREFSIGLMNLRDRLGMTPYAYTSKVRERLLGAHEELQGCGYLSEIEHREGASGDALVCDYFGDPTKPSRKLPMPSSPVAVTEYPPVMLSSPASASTVATIISWDLDDEETRG